MEQQMQAAFTVVLASMATPTSPGLRGRNDFVLCVACKSTGECSEIRRTFEDFRDLDRASRRSASCHLLPPFPPQKKLLKMAAAAEGQEGGTRPFREHTKTTAMVNQWLAACGNSPAAEEPWWLRFVGAEAGPVDAMRGSGAAGPDQQGSRAWARAMNQYFTRPAEAKLLVSAALDMADTLGLLREAPGGGSAAGEGGELVLIDPSAGDGAIFGLFPSEIRPRGCSASAAAFPIRRVGIELDEHYARKHGFVHADFLQVTRQSLGLNLEGRAGDDLRSRAVVVMNPPFVTHGDTACSAPEGGAGVPPRAGSNGRDGASSRDATLAAQFVAHAFNELADLVVALLPARFARREQIEAVEQLCHDSAGRRPHSWVVGGVLKGSRFDLAGHMKAITQPSVIVAFSATEPPQSATRQDERGPPDGSTSAK